MTALIIGGSGQVGYHLSSVLSDNGFDVIGTYSSHYLPGLQFLDIRDINSVKLFIKKINPDFVFVPASLTNVDYCERFPEESAKINIKGLMNVVDAVEDTSSKLIYFSSDYIFDGLSGPYKEFDHPNPICEYGKQKLISEKYISEKLQKYLICRTTVVYSWEIQAKNFVQRLIQTLQEGNCIRIPIDQIGTPTYAPNLAEIVMQLNQQKKYGIFHVAGPDLVSRYEFARLIAREFGFNPELIIPIETKDLNQAARRPLRGGLDISKLKKISDINLIGCVNGLKLMKTLLPGI